MARSRSSLVALALASLACGPTIPSQDGATTTHGGSESSDTDDPSTSSSSSFSTTAVDTDTDTDTDTDEGIDFVPADDLVDTGECDPLNQDCPEDEKCVPYDFDDEPDFDGDKCVPILGNGGAGDPCIWDGPLVATDDCDGEHMCYFVAEGPDGFGGTCTAFCQGTFDNPICPEMQACYSDSGRVFLCVGVCDPLAQDCLDENALCQWGQDEFVCIQRGAGLAAGEPCSLINECAAGNLCLDAALVPGCVGDACCTPFCELGVAGACDVVPGSSCEAFFRDPPPPGYELIGVCVSP